MADDRSTKRCSVAGCGLLYIDHKAGKCAFCGGPLEHHKPGEVDECKAGRARMAAARQAAGSPLDKVDLFVLGRSA